LVSFAKRRIRARYRHGTSSDNEEKDRAPVQAAGGEFVYIGIRLPPDEARAVEAMAVTGQTVQQVVRDLVSEALAARVRRKGGKP
jgi:hypothetical protein